MFTGLSGAGKSTIAGRLVEQLQESGRTVTLLDGDEVRTHLSAGLGFSKTDRNTNVRRIGWVAGQIAKHGGIAVCAPIAPYAATRAEARRLVEAEAGPGSFLLVHVATPLTECEARDRKGLYAKARRGEIAEFTGITDPYEAPTDAEITLDTRTSSIEQSARLVLDMLLDGLAGRR
jgi:sulfate adenylyltransferase